jgi:hypothetical protein
MIDHELAHNAPPKLLVTVIDRDQTRRLEEILREKHVSFHYTFNAMGTANSKMLKAFGLSGSEKTACICIEPAYRAKPLIAALVERMELTRPGNGIAFILPISGISAALSGAFSQGFEEHRERWMEWMDREAEQLHQDTRYELVIAVVNQGYSEKVIDVAHLSGARGGTIVHARRSGMGDAGKFFGILVQEEKEIIAILISKSSKKELMQAIGKACGIKTEAQGIVFSMPVECCAGIAMEDDE